MQIIKKYFPGCSEQQFERLEALWPLYRAWNQKVNVISRKDIDFFYERHVLHSLSVLKVIQFVPGTEIMDFGTGGGFPGIPLAIACPGSRFLLVDSVGKKVMVINEIVKELQLKNVEAVKMRGEEIDRRFDFVISRAVKSLPVFMPWVRNKIRPGGDNELPNGVLYLKGGDFADELQAINENYRIFDLSLHFTETFFDTKKIIFLYEKHGDKSKK